jgi:NAD(P)-dependent dehydrogenase (short-subunit alcohol dehydrogenase family)
VIGTGGLDGKVAVVTGAAGGIGGAIAAHLAGAGARVVASDLRRPDAPDERFVWVCGDIAEEPEVGSVIDTARATFGRLDVLVNVAALTGAALERDRTVVDTPLEVWDRVMAVNLRGTMLMCRHAIPVMLEGGGGAIVNISSRAAATGNTRFCAYSASKAALNSLTMTIARSFGKQGIRCNAIMPGIVMGTDSMGHGSVTDDYLAAALRRLAVGRLGQPDDVARLALFLASDELSGYLNGQILNCDGGQSV